MSNIPFNPPVHRGGDAELTDVLSRARKGYDIGHGKGALLAAEIDQLRALAEHRWNEAKHWEAKACKLAGDA